MWLLVSFWFCSRRDEEGGFGWFALVVLCCVRDAVCVLCAFLAVHWVCLWSMILTFPGHTQLFFL